MLVWCSRAAACGLAKEPLQPRGRGHPGRRQDLQRHVPAERLLLRLVDDPHAAAADLPQDAEVAQPLQRARRKGRAGALPRPRELAVSGRISSMSKSVGKRSRIRRANCGCFSA